jgi:hypothetical protein
MEPTIHCNQLLLQAPRMIADFNQVARASIPLDQRQQFAATYMAWYAAGQHVILDELRAYFETRYSTSIGGMPSIRDLITWLTSTTETDLRRLSGRFIVFTWAVEEQCEALRMTRREIFPRPVQIPYELRYAIAMVCKRVYRESSIDRLFTDNGCILTWWMPPLKPVPTKRMTRVMGWFDGIVLYAPERELRIARAICREILRKPRVAQQQREEVMSILQQLTLPAPREISALESSGQPAPAHDRTAVDDQAAVIETKQRRLHILEQQQAQKGHNTPPEIIIEIEDLRRELGEVEG